MVVNGRGMVRVACTGEPNHGRKGSEKPREKSNKSWVGYLFVCAHGRCRCRGEVSLSNPTPSSPRSSWDPITCLAGLKETETEDTGTETEDTGTERGRE